MTEPTPEEVEAVAQAIWENNDRYAVSIGIRKRVGRWGAELEEHREQFRDTSRAAILALDQHRKAKGD